MNGPLAKLQYLSARRASLLIGTLRERQRRFEEPIAIYGLFQRNGKCRYVGATNAPYNRSIGHQATTQRRTRAKLTLMVLRYCSVERSHIIETQVIKAFKRRGQCDLNQKNGAKRSVNRDPLIYSREEDKIFFSAVEAATYFDCSDSSIHNYCKDGTYGLMWARDDQGRPKKLEPIIDYSI